jgi:multiple antibiotic resistance protein
MAADMVMGRHMLRATPEEERAAVQEDDISVFPLAIPLLAGPGAMTSMVLLHEQAGGDLWRLAGVLIALVVALGVTLACLLAAGVVTRLLGATGAHVIGRVLGVLLAALAAQIALEGVRESLG